MALAQQSRNAPAFDASLGGLKAFSQVRDSQAVAGAQDASAALRVKLNPDWSKAPDGTEITAATVEVDATNIILDINGGLNRQVAYAGKDQITLVREINAPAANGDRYWRAGLADVEPNTAIAPAILAETNAALGYLDSVPLQQSSASFLYIAQGSDESEKGAGAFVPIPFDTDYNYDIQTSPGVPASTVGRGGGISADQGEDILPQKASRFGTSNIKIARERHPARIVTETLVTSISHNLLAGGENLIFQIFQIDDGTVPIWGIEVPDTQNEIIVPEVRTTGPAYLSVNAKAFGVFTAGIATLRGYTRLS